MTTPARPVGVKLPWAYGLVTMVSPVRERPANHQEHTMTTITTNYAATEDDDFIATAAEILREHRATWDMPTLNTWHPEMIEWIAVRWDVQFDMASYVVTIDKVSGEVVRHDTQDVREALARLLDAVVLSSL